MMKKEVITKEDTINMYQSENGLKPSWANKMFKEMNPSELTEYQLYRVKIKKERRNTKKENSNINNTEVTDNNLINNKETIKEDIKNNIKESNISQEEINNLLLSKGIKQVEDIKPIEDIMDEDYYVKENKWPMEEKINLVSHTTQKLTEELLDPRTRELLTKQKTEDEFIENYIKNHQIKDQAHMNYAVEHDEKFRMFLEKTERLKEVYKGRHLEEIERKKKEINEELTKEAKKDKRNKIVKRFQRLKPEKRIISNDIKDSKKELDLTAYRNKKLEKQGFILCLYLRKNGLMDIRYVKMDEVGQIKVDGYVYHERDATYRFGKKNDPVLVIIEGSLVPINKETLKEHLGFESAEAQKLVIKGIEQAEVVKAGGIDDIAKKPFTPSKWLIGIGIALIIGVYAYMGGFS